MGERVPASRVAAVRQSTILRTGHELNKAWLMSQIKSHEQNLRFRTNKTPGLRRLPAFKNRRCLQLDDRSSRIASMERTHTYHDTRERVLSIGESLILARGFSAVGLSEILGKAEVPKGSFYHYFKSKEGFGVALLERYFEEYDARLSGLFAAEAPGGRQLVLAYFRNWLDTQGASGSHHSCLAVKLAAEVCDLSEPMRQELAKGMNGIVAHLAAAIRTAQADGALKRQVDAEQLAESLYAMWVGASLLARANGSNAALERAYRQTEQMLDMAGA
jgi:TetR/AcrR family transcriptional repressor of nem operon